jgi:putative transposase
MDFSHPSRPNSLRLPDYDYTQPGAYYVTIVTWQRRCVFGEIVDGVMQLNDSGYIVTEEWEKTPQIRPLIEMDEFVVMPNHVHGIILINEKSVGAMRRIAPTQPNGAIPDSIGAILGQIKSITTKQINRLRNTPGAQLWQRNYYDHIIRSEKELNQIRAYIQTNPHRWELDHENPYVQ